MEDAEFDWTGRTMSTPVIKHWQYVPSSVADPGSSAFLTS